MIHVRHALIAFLMLPLSSCAYTSVQRPDPGVACSPDSKQPAPPETPRHLSTAIRRAKALGFVQSTDTGPWKHEHVVSVDRRGNQAFVRMTFHRQHIDVVFREDPSNSPLEAGVLDSFVSDFWNLNVYFVEDGRIVEPIGCKRARDSSGEFLELEFARVPADSDVYVFIGGHMETFPSPATRGTDRCACCGHKTLGARGYFEICPVCYWEDDGEDEDCPRRPTCPNGDVRLNEARKNFRDFGACDQRHVGSTRPPKPYER